MRVNRHLSLGLLVGLVALTGCSADPNGGSDTSAQRVAGTLRMTGGPAGVSQPGVVGQVVFTSGDNREVTEAAADGSFAVSLTAGTYTVTGTSPLYGDGQGVCRADAPFVVADASVSDVVVACSRR
jgi:hypothetical protein